MCFRSLSFIPLIFLSIQQITAQHTFSIVAVDSITGEIGSAGATCIAAEFGAIDISVIVLGVGAIHTQSYWDPNNQINATARMEAGDSPEEIIDWLTTNDVNNNPSLRQYGVVDLNNGHPRSAAYTGNNCFEEYIHVTGPNYAIAGNILISDEVVLDMETAFLNTDGSLADRLMGALQAAKRPGADSRCLDDGVSSASAFIRVAAATDTDNSYGNLSLDLNVWIELGGLTFEPIDALQEIYDSTLVSTEVITNLPTIRISPNPAHNNLLISSNEMNITSYQIMNIAGSIILERQSAYPVNFLQIDISEYASGTYFINIYNKNKMLSTEKLMIK